MAQHRAAGARATAAVRSAEPSSTTSTSRPGALRASSASVSGEARLLVEGRHDDQHPGDAHDPSLTKPSAPPPARATRAPAANREVAGGARIQTAVQKGSEDTFSRS